MGVVLLYFGGWRALPLMTVPVGVGVALAMGLAGVAFGALNATSAFLGSIIVGNGINYPILQLARYEEERARGRGAAAALDGALAATLRPTALAAFAAAAAYASLALTRFRGFSQFGVIGAAGMVLCWAASMTVLPALIWALDGRRGASVTGSSRPPRRLNFGRPFAQLVATAPLLLVVAGVGLSVLAVAALPRWLADPFEYDFEQLRRISDDDAQAADLDGVFGRALAPSVLLAQSRTEAAEARRVVLARAGAQAQAQAPSPVAKVVTLDELLPGTPDEVARKLALLVEIRRLLSPANLSLLSDEDQRRAADLRPPANLRSYDERALPPLMRRPFTERDGTLGRIVLIYPPTQEEGFSLSNGRDLIRLSDAIRDVPLADGRVLHATGRAVIFAAMLESIAHDGPVATGASFAAVALITCLLLARRRTGQAETAATAAVILGTLALGVLWMLGMAAAFGVKLNVLNFVALPITFGIGVDYAANVYLRYRWQRSSDAQDPAVEVGDDVTPRVLRSTGGAVVLNSLTTVLGYGTLLLAHSRALRSFGALAVLGELGCLAAAMLLMPAVLTMAGRRRRARVEGRVPAA